MSVRNWKKIFVVSLSSFALLCTSADTGVHAAAIAVTPTDVSTASAGNVLIGVDGTFTSADLQAGVKRINEIRKEAYDEGIVSAYVPVKLSEKLIGLANIRAAEAALEISHTRPNGTMCNTTVYQGMKTYGEILAWNFRGLVDGINQWYEEKEDLVKKTGGVTGHYTQMIDPKNEYMGLSCFKTSSGAKYPYSICGEFNSYASHTDVTERVQPSYDVTQLMEVPQSTVTVQTSSVLKGKAGEHQMFGLPVKYKNQVSAKIYDLAWTSSSEGVAQVRDNQLICSGAGRAVLSAMFQGKKYEVTVDVYTLGFLTSR